MASRKSPIKITEEIYNNCKELVNSKAFNSIRIGQILNIAQSTVCRIAKTETYEEYVDAASKGYKPLIKSCQEEEKKEEPKNVLASFAQVSEITNEVRKNNELLSDILIVLKQYLEV